MIILTLAIRYVYSGWKIRDNTLSTFRLVNLPAALIMLFKSNLILSRRSQNRLATSRLVSSWDFFIRPRVLTRFTPYNTRQVTMRYNTRQVTMRYNTRQVTMPYNTRQVTMCYGASLLVASLSLKLASFVLYLYITTLLVLNARTYIVKTKQNNFVPILMK